MRLLVRGRRARVAQEVPRNLDSRPDWSRGATGGHHHHYGHHHSAATTSCNPAAAPSGGQTGYATGPAAPDDDDDNHDDIKRSESATNAPSPTADPQIADRHRQTGPPAAPDHRWQPCRCSNVKTASIPAGATSLVRILNHFVHAEQQLVFLVLLLLVGTAQNKGTSVAIRHPGTPPAAAIAAQPGSPAGHSTPRRSRPAVRLGTDSFQLDEPTAQTSTIGGVSAQPIVAPLGSGRVPAATAKLQGVHQHIPEALRSVRKLRLFWNCLETSNVAILKKMADTRGSDANYNEIWRTFWKFGNQSKSVYQCER